MSIDLAQALAAGATVITPNRRLALRIKGEYDTAQALSGSSVWPSADVLPYGAFIERTWQELALAENGALLLSPQQEVVLWETVIEASRFAGLLLNPSAAARSARDAWITLNAFSMDSVQHRATWDAVNEDAAAFSEWRRSYVERLRSAGWIDSAQLPTAIAAAIRAGARLRAGRIVRTGHDAYTPQQQLLFDALAASGHEIEETLPATAASGNVVRHASDDAEAELHFIAGRVRSMLIARNGVLPHLRIGVVVPDLASRRMAVLRVFDDTLEPLRVTTPGTMVPRLYNCSLGLPLTSYALVATALGVLRLAGGELTLAETGALLRSPFIGAADAEFAARAQLDSNLRAGGHQRISAALLLQAAHSVAPQLAALLESWRNTARAARSARQPPSAWSTTFLSLLSGMGWPGERTLDSAEFQTFEKFRDIVSGLSAMDLLRSRLTCGEALSILRGLASDAVFQPEVLEAPVQILGTLESTGLTFDALFVTGFGGETWPAAPHPNPFLPVALQRALEVPHASAQWELQFARRMTGAWRSAAPVVTFTWHQRDGERELTMSPLIDDVPEGTLPTTSFELLRDVLFEARRVEMLADWCAPPLAEGARVGGGTQMLQNQAACPFRAYAIHRLGARALEESTDGLDARERGNLAHQALAQLWRDIGSQAHLLALGDSELEACTASAVNTAVDVLCRARPDLMSDAFATLERERLKALLGRLIALEKKRAPFEVMACEQQLAPLIAGVQLSARLDRVDRLADGSHLILDYKTGLAHIGAWMGERPDEPQLPLYAVSGDAAVSGVAFVQMRAREVAFKGLTRDENVLPDVAALSASKALAAQYAGWPALLESWRAILEQLAREYRAGHAEVTPKRFTQTCEYCELGALCRVRELMARSASGDAEESEAR